VIETSLNVYNLSVYRPFVRPRGSVLSWARSVVSNRLASSGADWAALIAR